MLLLVSAASLSSPWAELGIWEKSVSMVSLAAALSLSVSQPPLSPSMAYCCIVQSSLLQCVRPV